MARQDGAAVTLLPRLRDCDWVLGAGPLSQWLAAQIEALVQAVCGVPPRVARTGPRDGEGGTSQADPVAGEARAGHGESSDEPSGFTIAVGSPGDCEAVEAAAGEGLLELDELGPEDFGIRRATVAGADTLLVYGHELRTASYGVFYLLETLGCRFTVSRDVVPPSDPQVRLPATEGVFHTDNRWRGIWFQYCFATNSSMSLADHGSLFDQMAKMRLNRVVFYHFENEPFVDYTFRGERKVVGDIAHPESGYISYGRQFSGSYRVEDVAIGAEKFGRERVAPLELQEVNSSEEALVAGRAFMQQVMELARQRGLACWLSYLPQFIPLSLLKYARRMPRPHLHWSGLVSAADPVVDEINRVRLQAIWEAYPNLEGIFLGVPEGYYDDPYEDSRNLVDERRPEYERAYQLHRELWGQYWSHNEELLEQHIRQDIGFGEILQRTVQIARELQPGCRLGVITVCKAYLLTHLHTLLPQDVAFADIESRSLWTVDGAPLHLFREMEGRECAIIPRAVDDGSMAGMQFDLELYARDRYLQSARENGTAGLIVQTTHVRGNEHNMGYLAAGMWDADLTPEAFYSDYCERLFGREAGAVVQRAFAVLEENEIRLGGRGSSNMPWNKVPAHIEVLRAFRTYPAPFFGVPYDEGFVQRLWGLSERYLGAVERLERAQELYEEAAGVLEQRGEGGTVVPLVRDDIGARGESTPADGSASRSSPPPPPGARHELAYLMARNTGYRHHLSCLVELAGVYGRLREVLTSHGSVDEIRAGLAQVLDMAERAGGQAEASARAFSDCAEHATDLGVLWMVNSSMVTGTRVLGQYLSNVKAYYDGREYWNPVDWDRLFGTCPHPAYGMDTVSPSPLGQYEPG